ncbi:MAG TPA: DUF2254 domain-containing protein [Burkholderiaceae bacterium]|nr:DUF2254 domain-containing protein [Burkholderiaceae bacterium]
MKERLRQWWEQTRASLWFLPTLMMVAAAVLALFGVPLELRADWAAGEAQGWLHRGSGRSASDLISSLLTSMITMTAVVISITMVVLTLAQTQLGPRLIRNFLGDLKTQAMLGVFMATIVHLLLVLPQIDDQMTAEQVPHVSVTLGIAGTLLSVGMLLIFTHHLARSMVTEVMIDRVGRELDHAAERLLPKRQDADGEAEARVDGQPGTLTLTLAGYVQAIDRQQLADTAERAGASIRLDFHAGQHLLPGATRVRVFPASAATPQLQRAVEAAVITGTERTPPQDLEFGITQLVQIAMRALSPGINDPFTAMSVVDRLAISLAAILQRGAAPARYRDRGGNVRLELPAIAIDELTDAAFNQIRQASAEHADVLIRLLSAICGLMTVATDGSQRRALLRHADLIRNQAQRSLPEAADREDVERHHARVRRLSSEPDSSET